MQQTLSATILYFPHAFSSIFSRKIVCHLVNHIAFAIKKTSRVLNLPPNQMSNLLWVIGMFIKFHHDEPRNGSHVSARKKCIVLELAANVVIGRKCHRAKSRQFIVEHALSRWNRIISFKNPSLGHKKRCYLRSCILGWAGPCKNRGTWPKKAPVNAWHSFSFQIFVHQHYFLTPCQVGHKSDRNVSCEWSGRPFRLIRTFDFPSAGAPRMPR